MGENEEGPRGIVRLLTCEQLGQTFGADTQHAHHGPMSFAGGARAAVFRNQTFHAKMQGATKQDPFPLFVLDRRATRAKLSVAKNFYSSGAAVKVVRITQDSLKAKLPAVEFQVHTLSQARNVCNFVLTKAY